MELHTSENSATLHTSHTCRRTVLYRCYAVIQTCGIIALIYHHVHSLLTEHTVLLTSLLLISDVILAFMWASTTSLRLNPVHRTEYPEKYVAKPEEHFPKLDVFICTADPYKEPPMMVANTVLSVMAYGYPSDKISVYVSDDGGSSSTLFALMEAAKFSEHWLPFCKKNNVQDRSPEVYFSSKSNLISFSSLFFFRFFIFSFTLISLISPISVPPRLLLVSPPPRLLLFHHHRVSSSDHHRLRFTVYRIPRLGSENTPELSMTTWAEQDDAEISCRLVLGVESARKKKSEFSSRFAAAHGGDILT
ncbi:Cellulose synthase protein [Raphanus sativus]|nr:Cellulose synthase protein [Raphanus sativus]